MDELADVKIGSQNLKGGADDGILAPQALAELRLLVDVAVLESEPGQHEQVLVLLAIARQHRNRMPVLDQAGDQAGTEESGAAENADGQWPHEVTAVE